MIFKRKSKELEKIEDKNAIDELVNNINKEEQEAQNSNVREIAYTRATFWKRCSIILFDLICCGLLSVGCFMGIQQIVNNTPKMQDTHKFLDEKQNNSGLYKKMPDTGKFIDTVQFYKIDPQYTPGQAIAKYEISDIPTFFKFLNKELGEKTADTYYQEFLDYKMKAVLDDGTHVFVKTTDGEVVRNPVDAVTDKAAIEKFYDPYMKIQATSIFITKIPHVYEAQKYISNYFFFLEIPLSLFIGFLVIYYIIPLCFYKGKQTLGRVLMQTGLVDNRVLRVSFGRFTARFCIMFFGEVLLSLVTLGIPIFVSFTLMAFSKNKQNFHDYMLGIHEVDVSNDKIYKSLDELISKPQNYDLDNFKPQ